MKKIIIFLMMLALIITAAGCVKKDAPTPSGGDYDNGNMLLDPGQVSGGTERLQSVSDEAIKDTELKTKLTKEKLETVIPLSGITEPVVLEEGNFINVYSNEGIALQVTKTNYEMDEKDFWGIYEVMTQTNAFNYTKVENLADGAFTNNDGVIYFYYNRCRYMICVEYNERFDNTEKAKEVAALIING